ncbi:thiamine pyrophosphate-dependent enzyme [Chloroflexota bacterium]
MKRQQVAGVPRLFTRDPRGAIYCPGCHYGIIQRLICECLEETDLGGRAIAAAGSGCQFTFFYAVEIDQVLGAHGRAPDIMTAIKRLLPDRLLLSVQGDGDAIAIGAGSLINAAARAEKITVIMFNNLGYAMTGGQLAPTTLIEQKTTTTPEGRIPHLHGYPIHTPELLATLQGVVYCARGTVHTPANFKKTKNYLKNAFRKQMNGEGFTFLEIISACPTRWHLSPLESLNFIENNVIKEYPLGEIKNVESCPTDKITATNELSVIPS